MRSMHKTTINGQTLFVTYEMLSAYIQIIDIKDKTGKSFFWSFTSADLQEIKTEIKNAIK